ncbi:hypothetical protein Pint_21657 [Pistacia integerrima]|uniref:Uncharacterized protein n=1 Tax=Pistacia integerrima TaxID=434235 RepID=A0ACC0XDF9_9ROSI|nr:hypothetical protein Pint_21657 [Pistacia integerrima]
MLRFVVTPCQGQGRSKSMAAENVPSPSQSKGRSESMAAENVPSPIQSKDRSEKMLQIVLIPSQGQGKSKTIEAISLNFHCQKCSQKASILGELIEKKWVVPAEIVETKKGHFEVSISVQPAEIIETKTEHSEVPRKEVFKVLKRGEVI